MEVISGEDFEIIVYSDNAETISDLIIEITTPLNIDLGKVNLGITFSNIKFSGKQIKFYRYQQEGLHRFTFEYCTFASNIFFESNFDNLTFISNTFNCDKFHIIKSNIKVLKFSDDDSNSENIKYNIFNKGNFKIHNCEFDILFWIKNVQFMEDTTIDISCVKFLNGCYFDFNLLNNIMFYNCDFYKEFRYDCSYKLSQFRECNFLSKTIFLGMFNVNLDTSFLWFDNCTFSKLANFNGYFVHKLRIEDTTFLDNVTLQKTYLNIITIVRTVFEKKVWFENIQINQIENCDIETIRTIKHELQKAENRIDFNRFRSYELAAHYKELDWKWNSGFIDKSILFASKISTDFGNSWRKALQFTLMSGFIAFTLFFILENFRLNIDLNNWQNFLYGYFRFFLITDFKNEYYEAGESVLKFNCFFSLLPFIIGKIAVAFGIYEMIQSFRKFKA